MLIVCLTAVGELCAQLSATRFALHSLTVELTAFWPQTRTIQKAFCRCLLPGYSQVPLSVSTVLLTLLLPYRAVSAAIGVARPEPERSKRRERSVSQARSWR